mmetsp:Transcript_24970/g.60064  ORF Transcript_24970/g.60064 Transcript_24970/m.60064 type:complete len:124 (+) Transcript_24970:1528-1899(+)
MLGCLRVELYGSINQHYKGSPSGYTYCHLPPSSPKMNYLRKTHARVFIIVVRDALNRRGVQSPDGGENTSKDEEEARVVKTKRDTSTITVHTLINESLGRKVGEERCSSHSRSAHSALEVGFH